jgi:hypothetical protein
VKAFTSKSTTIEFKGIEKTTNNFNINDIFTTATTKKPTEISGLLNYNPIIKKVVTADVTVSKKPLEIFFPNRKAEAGSFSSKTIQIQEQRNTGLSAMNNQALKSSEQFNINKGKSSFNKLDLDIQKTRTSSIDLLLKERALGEAARLNKLSKRLSLGLGLGSIFNIANSQRSGVLNQSMTKTSQAQARQLKPMQLERQAQSFKPITDSLQKTGQLTDSMQKTSQKSFMEQTFKIGGGGSIFRVPTPAPFVPIPNFRPTTQERETDNQAYNVYAREQGRVFKLNKSPLPMNRAFNQGEYYINNTTARSFELRPSSRVSKVQDVNLRNNMNQYRERKGTKALKYVEKEAYSINTMGERQGLSLAKGLSSLKYKGGFKL